MNIWLPLVEAGSGADVFTASLAEELRRLGHRCTVQTFAHRWQYLPWRLGPIAPPPATQAIIANTWNGFAFSRPPLPLIVVQHLFVLDPALAPYRSFAQGVFHRILVRHFEGASRAHAARVVAVSRYTAEVYARVMGGEPPRVILNGIDTTHFTPGPEGKEALTGRPFRLLFVGNLSRRKGADLLAPIMRSLGPGFELSYTAGLRTRDPLARVPGARRLGRLDQDGVRAEYRRADAVLLPTRLEGLPLVAMEALACGTPVIASDTASLPEVLEHGRTGLLCAMDDPEAFAAAARRLASNDGERAMLGENARDSARTRFSLGRMAAEYSDLFEQLSG